MIEHPYLYVFLDKLIQSKILKDAITEKKKAGRDIAHLLTLYSNFFEFDISKKTRLRPYIYARMLFVREARNLGFSLQRIGGLFDMDHSTIVHYGHMFRDQKFFEKNMVLISQEILFLATDAKSTITDVLTSDNLLCSVHTINYLKSIQKYK